MVRKLGNPRGRPSKFDPELAAQVIARMMNGQDVKSAARAAGTNSSTVRGWAARDVGGFCADYEHAQRLLALIREDEAFSITEAGGRRARQEANWRLNFAERWLRGGSGRQKYQKSPRKKS